MSVKDNLKRALGAIKDARKRIRRVWNDSDQASTDLRRAEREIDSAISEIERTIKELQ